MLLANLPLAGLMKEPIVEIVKDPNTGKLVSETKELGGLLYYLYQGVKLGIYPPLIFLGVGAMTDFGPLIANPKSILLGAAAQFGIFFTFIGAIAIRIYRTRSCKYWNNRRSRWTNSPLPNK